MNGHLYYSKPFRVVTEKNFPESIVGISPRFGRIYNQALQAEENNLDEIAGPGYGKALEFLVKDYLTSYKYKEDPATCETVKKTLLGPCIENYIDELRIKDCAKRAAWLRNDEIHYIRKWEETDLNDLKNLISMTVSWIDLVITSDQYKGKMASPKKE